LPLKDVIGHIVAGPLTAHIPDAILVAADDVRNSLALVNTDKGGEAFEIS
jgi:hypothetical protein